MRAVKQIAALFFRLTLIILKDNMNLVKKYIVWIFNNIDVGLILGVISAYLISIFR